MDIALLGKAGSGKSTIAALLEERGYVKLSFADPLKKICGPYATRADHQRVGLGVRELTGGMGWVNYMQNQIESVWELVPIVVDDVRFTNEVEMLQELGFKVVRVVAPEDVRRARLVENGKDDGDLNHISETELDNYPVDCTITNNKDMASLRADVKNMFATLA